MQYKTSSRPKLYSPNKTLHRNLNRNSKRNYTEKLHQTSTTLPGLTMTVK